MALLTLQMVNNSASNSVPSAAVDNLSSASNSRETSSNVLLLNSNSSLQQQSKITTSNLNSVNLTTILCISISLAVKYFRSTSYLWMFNEGRCVELNFLKKKKFNMQFVRHKSNFLINKFFSNLAFYLHRLIKNAFTTPSLTPLLIIAYGIPALTTSIYISCRLIQLDLDGVFTSLTNQSYDSLNSSTPSLIASKFISKYLDQPHLDNESDLLNANLNSIRSYRTPMPSGKRLNMRFNFKNQSTNLSSVSLGAFNLQSLSIQSIDVQSTLQPSFADPHLNSTSNGVDRTDLDDIVVDQLNDLISTSYEDQCWSLPSENAWHEWVINLPNLCILVVSILFF